MYIIGTMCDGINDCQTETKNLDMTRLSFSKNENFTLAL